MDLSGINLEQNAIQIIPLISEGAELLKFQDYYSPAIYDVDLDIYGDWTDYFVKAFETFYKYAVRGLYHNKNIRFKDGCSGDELIVQLKKAKGVYERFNDDPWSVNLDEAETAIKGVMESAVEMQKQCEMKKVYDDINSWMLQNPEVVWGDDNGLSDRFTAHLIPILTNALDLTKTVVNSPYLHMIDTDYGNYLAEIDENVASLFSYMVGFDYEFNKS